MTTLSDNRRLEGFDEKTIDRDPIKQFQLWFNDAIAAKLPMPEAMTLATATPDGRPSARMVLLKQVDQDGFVFYTNYRSAKASQLGRKSLRRTGFLLDSARSPGACRGQCHEGFGGGVARILSHAAARESDWGVGFGAERSDCESRRIGATCSGTRDTLLRS
jgi:hypothetical protein